MPPKCVQKTARGMENVIRRKVFVLAAHHGTGRTVHSNTVLVWTTRGIIALRRVSVSHFPESVCATSVSQGLPVRHRYLAARIVAPLSACAPKCAVDTVTATPT